MNYLPTTTDFTTAPFTDRSRADLTAESTDLLWRSIVALGLPWPTDRPDLAEWIAFATDGFTLTVDEALVAEPMPGVRALNARRPIFID